MKLTSKKILMAAAITAAMSMSAVANDEDLRASLFSQADDALRAANAARANILAPENYEKAADNYRSAEKKLERKRNIDAINEDLQDVVQYLNAAIQATRLAEVTFAEVIQARNDAEAAESGKYAKKEWNEAEKSFSSAAKKLESGSVSSARKKGEDALKFYRSAELQAIKTNYLSEAKRLIDKAEDGDVKDYAPKTLLQAKQFLAKAEKELEENRYDTDGARSLARYAKYEAKHALYLSDIVEEVDDDKLSLEDFIIKAERAIDRVANELDLAVDFDEGLDKPIDQIIAKLSILRKDSYELSQRREDILGLEKEVVRLESKLGIQSDRIKQQEQMRLKFSKIESLFSSEQAQVYRQSGNVLIRMVGLNFSTGQSVIESKYFSLLKQVIEALQVFPGAEVVVEGHTDSFGGDALNLRISQQRADAVMEYIKANMAIDTISSTGFGESRPVASNETDNGRLKNRRIDLLIKPRL
ncbi:OmpA family protein [Dasania marina]|mgnify:CR=1 FL=1